MDNVKLFPSSLQAAQDVLANYSYGDVIPMAWLHENFDCHPPETGSMRDFQKYHLQFFSLFEQFRAELLENHSMALVNVRGEGYRILPPKDQTSYALERLKNRMMAEGRKTKNILVNIRHDLLTNDQRKENSDALAKLAAIKAFSKKQLASN